MDIALLHPNPAEAFAQANGILQAAIAWLLWRQVHVRKAWGLDWLALSMVCGAVINVGAPLLVTPNLAFGTAQKISLLVSVLVGFGSLAALVTGMVAYCEYYSGRLSRVFLAWWVLMPVLSIGAWALEFRKIGEGIGTLVFVYLAYITWATARRFPRTGHRQLALVMLSYPAIIGILHALALDPVQIRYLSSSPYTLIGVLLLSVTLNRQTAERERTRQELAVLNDALEQRVQERTLALETHLEELRRTQTQLVQTEKLAALGRLVAGVAHELNTPLGNMLVTVTTLSEHCTQVQQAQEQGQLRRSQLASFLETTTAASGLIERNTRKAADLVATFKRVAVDQSGLQRRSFALLQVVRDTLQMLEPSTRNLALEWELAVPEALVLDSYPGPLEQVLANLLQNAAIHAMPEGRTLHVRIAAQLQAREHAGVVIEIADDGLGMSAPVVAQAFDPYFSTRFGQGGSGLGLYIVYGLVTGSLGGEITLRSEPDRGACFSLWLPLQAPEVPATPLV